jgi:MFS transporter, DHA2 family, lincomycin resistance protein
VLGPGSPLVAAIGIHVLFAAGLALMMTPLMTASLGALPGHLYSHGSAIIATLQQIAGAFGTAVFVAVAAAVSGGTPDAGGLRAAFVAAGVVGVAGVVTALFVPGRAGVPIPRGRSRVAG